MSEEKKFTALEKKLLFEFLSELSDRMGNAGCNDYDDIPNTPEGRALFTAVARYNYRPEDATRELAEAFEHSGEVISTMDFIVFGYLRNKLEAILEK